MWQCIVINSLSTKERDIFFSTLNSIVKTYLTAPPTSVPIDDITDEVQLGGNIFTDDCMDLLFFEYLLRLDYRNITETIYECFESMFLHINQ